MTEVPDSVINALRDFYIEAGKLFPLEYGSEDHQRQYERVREILVTVANTVDRALKYDDA